MCIHRYHPLSFQCLSHINTGNLSTDSPPGQVKIDGSSHLAERKEELTAKGPKREKGGHQWDLELELELKRTSVPCQ